MQSKYLDPEIRNEVVRLYREGLSAVEVAPMVGVSQATACRILRSAIPQEELKRLQSERWSRSKVAANVRRGLSMDPALIPEGMKCCGRCKEVKPKDRFHKSCSQADGLMRRCRDCCQELDYHSRRSPTGKFNVYRQNARMRGLDFEITRDQFAEFWQKPCYYCGDPILTVGLDRLDNRKGYTMDNVVSCCAECNAMKSKLDPCRFVAKCQTIAERFLDERSIARNE